MKFSANNSRLLNT